MIMRCPTSCFGPSLEPRPSFFHGRISFRRSAKKRSRRLKKWVMSTVVDKYFKERNAFKESRDAALAEAERLSEELASAQQQEEYWRNEYIALKKQRRGSEPEKEEEVVSEANDVQEATFIAEEQFGEQLIFSLNNKSDDNTPYKSPTEVLKAITWLATYAYRDARMGIEKGVNLDESIKATVDGWFYSGGQSDVTALDPRFRSWSSITIRK